MLCPKSPQNSFYGSYLYDRIIPQDHLLSKINAVVDFSFVNDLVKDKYTPEFGRPGLRATAKLLTLATTIATLGLFSLIVSSHTQAGGRCPWCPPPTPISR